MEGHFKQLYNMNKIVSKFRHDNRILNIFNIKYVDYSPSMCLYIQNSQTGHSMLNYEIKVQCYSENMFKIIASENGDVQSYLVVPDNDYSKVISSIQKVKASLI